MKVRPHPRTAAEVLRDLAALVCELADIAERNTTSDEMFDSQALPPELRRLKIGRRIFAETCRSGRVSGAKRTGKIWSCSRTAWYEARSNEAAAKQTAKQLLGQTDRQTPCLTPCQTSRSPAEIAALALDGATRTTLYAGTNGRPLPPFIAGVLLTDPEAAE